MSDTFFDESLAQEILADAKAPVEFSGVSDEKLKSVADLAQEQLDLEEEIALREKELSDKKDRLTQVATQDLPAAMLALNAAKFELSDGRSIEIKKEYHAHISEANREAAHSWLCQNNHEDLIKNVLNMSFGKGENQKALKVMKWAQEKGIDVTQKQAVHPQTLKAFVKEQIENFDPEDDAAVELPQELFGVHVIDVAKIVTPKKKKK